MQFLDPSLRPSRLFLYYFARKLQGLENEDSGAYVSDVVKVARTMGAPQESSWPYVQSDFAKKPSTTVQAEAALHQTTHEQALLKSPASIKGAIAAGYPVIIGFTVFSSIWDESVMRTGVIPLPSAYDTVEGGHCVALWGYDDARRVYIARNSWSSDVGDKGYFYLPYDYPTSSLFEPWVVHTLEIPTAPPEPVPVVAQPPGARLASDTATVPVGTRTFMLTIQNNDAVASDLVVTKVFPKEVTSTSMSNTYSDVRSSGSVVVPATVNVLGTATPGQVLSVAFDVTSSTSHLVTRVNLTLTVEASPTPTTATFHAAFSASVVRMSSGTRTFPLIVHNVGSTELSLTMELVGLPSPSGEQISTLAPQSVWRCQVEVQATSSASRSHGVVAIVTDTATGQRVTCPLVVWVAP
jgi:hypothetical protein